MKDWTREELIAYRFGRAARVGCVLSATLVLVGGLVALVWWAT